MDKVKLIQITTILLYAILVVGVIYFDTLALLKGTEELDDYFELLITSVAFLIVYIHGSKRGSKYFYEVLKKLQIYPDLFLPGIFFVIIEFFVFIGIFFSLIYLVMIGFPLLYILVVAGIYGLIIFTLFSFIHNYFNTLSFGTEIVMYKQWSKGTDPKFFDSARKVINDKKTFYITLEFMGFSYIGRMLERISRILSYFYSGMIVHPLRFLTLYQAYYEDKGIIEATDNAFSTLRKRFTESVYGTETSSMASILVIFSFVFLVFSTGIIFPTWEDPGIVQLIASKRYIDITLIFLYWIFVLLGSLIIHSIVRSTAPLYFIVLSKSIRKTERSEIIEFFQNLKKQSKLSSLLSKSRISSEDISEENFLKTIDISEEKMKEFRERSLLRKILKI